MEFQKDGGKILGKGVGFAVMFLVFVSIFYFLLKLLGKMPEWFGYLNLFNALLSVALIGILLRFWLK